MEKKTLSIVSAKYIKQVNRKNLCATFYCAVIYIQRIPIRLFQIIDIPIEQGVYVIKTALEGFHSIFQKTGYFDVQSNLICINRQGKVKVWANKNLSKNYPQFSSINHNKSQSDFILKIISIIQQAIDFEGIKKFSEFLQQKGYYIRFLDMNIYINEYTKRQKIINCKQMKSILQLYSQRKNSIQNKNQININQPKQSIISQSQHYNHFKKFKKLQNKGNKKNVNLLFINHNRQPSNHLRSITPKKSICLSYLKSQNQYVSNHHPQSNFNPYWDQKKTQISFSYKTPGLYSPQNSNQLRQPYQKYDTQPSQMYPIQKKYIQQKKQQNRRKAVSSQTNNLYYSLTNQFSIDPQIAQDLQNLQK